MEPLLPQLLTYDDIVIQYPREKEVIKHKEYIEQFLPIIQDNKHRSLDILTGSPTKRYVIYTLCRMLDIRHERIEKHGNRHFTCYEFPGPNRVKKYTRCGCANVPDKWMDKYEKGLDYDDLYRQFEVPWVYKLGVRIFYDSINSDTIDDIATYDCTKH